MIRRSLFFATAGLLGAIAAISGCSDEKAPVTKGPQPARASGDLAFAFTDVAGSLGYSMRNRTGTEFAKNYIVEAMPPGIAIGDFDGDGRMDLFCPNGNSLGPYDRARRRIRFLDPAEAPRNELYLNKVDGLKAHGKAAGVDDQGWAFGAVAGDIDNDGDADILVCNWGYNLLYLNRGDGTFEEVGAAAGVAGDVHGWSTGACFWDFDRDGDLDIYICQYADMYEYFDDPARTKINPDGTLVGRTCDWKGLKVYCGPTGLKPQNDVLYESQLAQTGKLTFTDVTKKMGLWFADNPRARTVNSAGPFYGFVPVAFDIDDDGWQDLFVANDSVDNTCWINKKGKSFENEAPQMSLQRSASDFVPQASMGVAVGDLNEDGIFDMLITEFSHDQFNVLIGERTESGFTVYNEKAPNIGMRDITFFKLGWGANLFDVDLDGDLDIFFACGHVFPEVDHPRFQHEGTSYKQQNLMLLTEDARRLRIRDVSGLAGPGLQIEKASRASVAFDLDGDGDLDIATTELNDAPCLLRCDLDRTKAPHHWLMVRLVGKPAAGVPLDPAGAVVRITMGERKLLRLLLFGSSFQSNEDPRLHFGLGRADKVDKVEVVWPNGKTTAHPGVKADQIITIVYPDSE